MGTYRNFLVISLAVMTTGYLATPASAQPNVTANNFLHCMGLNSTDMSDSKMHEHKLRTLIGEALDIYAFLRSTYGHDSILELAAHINVSVPQDMQLQSTVFIQLWFQVKLKPLLMAVPKEALSCLGAMNFSCETYQIMVKELSDHFSSLDPARQKYIYMSFMKPFLHRMNDTSGKGCVSEENNSEAWLMKNFGAFRVLAQFKDFSTLNMAFDGLAVLHLLTPEQKAELLLHPEMGHVDNASVSLVFESLLKPLLNNEHNKPEAMVNQTSPIHNQKEGLKGFLDYLKPLGSFVKHFVSLTHKTNVSSMRSHKLTQAVLNWTLAELAGHFPKNITLKNDTKPSSPPTAETFDLTEMNDWFQHVVVPVLKRFLPHNQTEIPHDLTAIFYHVFSLNMTVSPPPFGAKDNCAINNDNICPISNTVENLAHIFGCISKTNLSVEHVGPLVNMLKDQYVNLVQSMNVTSLPETAVRPQLNSFTSESFQDVDFTNLWFYVKMRPFLPNVSAEFLSCLSTKNFSCESYTALIMGMTHYMSSMKHERQEMVYKHFIYPFLAHRQNKGMSCMANDSREWVMKNFGGFSVFAPLHNFFSLHSNFSALEAVPVLSPKQVAELVVLSHPGLPQRDVIINKVFDNLREPKDYTMFLPHLVMFVKEMPLSCPSTQLISMRLRHALSSTPKESEPAIWASMSALRHTVPGVPIHTMEW
ncbi:hypothetical protein JZ751_012872 [Albula glossodonta]|uniref:Uncharacterized protein n=1 Tax=Albula glossodonta TaxID=121402 RepID=A0A8T2MYS4_9TELE|nr:hypothetical protein JZ751_012872 [Albula glossodonta]